jgi:thiol-disulfide isomerase/thioredoxin
MQHPAVGRVLTEVTLYPLSETGAGRSESDKPLGEQPSDIPDNGNGPDSSTDSAPSQANEEVAGDSDKRPTTDDSLTATIEPRQTSSVESADNQATPVTSQDLAGQVSLLNFWGTWCFPCRLELPHLAKLHAQWREDDRIRFLFISCDDPLPLTELERKTKEFLHREGLEIPIYTDPGQVTRRHLSDVADFRGGFSYPTTIILDDQQRIRGLWQGFQEEDLLEQAKLLEELLP